MATPTSKRVVVHIVKGRHAGMRKIIGHLVIDPDTNTTEAFPPSIKSVDLADHVADVVHAGTFERYILYREWAKPVTQTFGQRTDVTFDPRQA